MQPKSIDTLTEDEIDQEIAHLERFILTPEGRQRLHDLRNKKASFPQPSPETEAPSFRHDDDSDDSILGSISFPSDDSSSSSSDTSPDTGSGFDSGGGESGGAGSSGDW